MEITKEPKPVSADVETTSQGQASDTAANLNDTDARLVALGKKPELERVHTFWTRLSARR